MSIRTVPHAISVGLVVVIASACSSQWITRPEPAPQVVEDFEPAQLRVDTRYRLPGTNRRQGIMIHAPFVRNDTVFGTTSRGGGVTLPPHEITRVAIRAADIRALPAGQRVDLLACRGSRSTACQRTASGTLVAIGADSVTLAPDASAETFPADNAARLRAVVGTRGNAGSGALIGLMSGILLGALIGSQAEFCVYACGPATGLGVLVGAPVGLLIGAAIGSGIETERWASIPIGSLRKE